MPDIALDLRYLRYAMLVAEQGSFRRAATLLDVSQSTISRRVGLLERRLGAPLFERDRSGARLTPLGERFMRDAAIGAEHLRRAIRDATSGLANRSKSLRIGVIGSSANMFLAELFGAYRARFPNVHVNLEEGTSEANISGILNGWLDVAFTLSGTSYPGCRSVGLWSEQVFVALPEGHALASQKDVRLADLREETFLVTTRIAGPDLEGYLSRWAEETGFRPRTSSHKVGSEHLFSLVAKNYGVTLSTCSTFGLTHEGVVFLLNRSRSVTNILGRPHRFIARSEIGEQPRDPGVSWQKPRAPRLRDRRPAKDGAPHH